MVLQSNGFCVSMGGLILNKINMSLFLLTARQQTLHQAMCIEHENTARFHYMSQIQQTLAVCQQSNL